MSYNNAALTGANLTVDGTTYQPSTPMLYDIYAVQRLYGSPHVDPSGSTTFGFNASSDLPVPYDFTKNTHPVLTIYSHTANNTLDLSGFTSDSAINLHSAAFSSFAGMRNNAAIYYSTKVDTLIEGSGTNAVYANDDPDMIVGGSGANTIFLGRGTDTVQSSGNDTIMAGAGDVIANASGAALLFAGAGNETIHVTSGRTQAVGSTGRLSVRVAAGEVTVQAGAGGSTVFGGAGRVTAWGKAAGDVLFGGQAGGNVLLGGAGTETLAGSGAGDLLVAARTGGDLLAAGAGNVTLTGAGSLGANAYFGGGAADLIAAGAGSDTVVGGRGADTVFGGSGHADIFEGSGSTLAVAGPGADYVQGGTGQATVVAGTGVDVFGFVFGHGGGTDLISKFKPGVDLISLQGFGPDAVAAALGTARASATTRRSTLPTTRGSRSPISPTSPRRRSPDGRGPAEATSDIPVATLLVNDSRSISCRCLADDHDRAAPLSGRLAGCGRVGRLRSMACGFNAGRDDGGARHRLQAGPFRFQVDVR